ncbi:MAG: leucine--tRNA ligase [Patescibacteria group bacterium]
MQEKYDHKEIEKKWQKKWQEDNLYKTEDEVKGKENFYTLVEFPYPSGNLHIGHWYAFAVPDIFARTKRMQGYNVMFPIGFDAFGLPAENAAIKHGVDPRKWTYENIAYMEKQLQSMGNSFDWSRKVITSDPEYYKWTQWLFLKLYEKGLAYKKKASVNWCPSCNTVLANEQVVAGKCERCDAEVIQKDLEQWFFKITDYAEDLLSDLDNLKWPEEIKTAQKNWIGKSEGTVLKFEIRNSKSEIKEKIKVFTTRADTLMGATYVVVAPEHPWLTQEILNSKSEIRNKEEIQKYINQTKQKTEIERTNEKKEKTGVEIKGVKVINPANGEEIPVFVADYVLGNYGTGAIMAVPSHDERDMDFAKKYNLPVKEITLDWDLQKFGQKVTKYKLRDWLLSRQRYWGCPIPIVYDPEGKPHPVPKENLPWLLPEDVKDFAPKGESPIATSKELRERVEKIFGEGWKPEYDTMDTFIDSSWYFLRYCDSKNKNEPFDKLRLKKWMPVNRYSGGAEHNTMHLLYSRFFHKALFDLGLVNESEPFIKRMNRALILGPDGQKMSKSKGNVVDPDEMVEKVGSDTVKMYLAFIGPYNETGQYPWDLGGVVGIRRFLERVWKIAAKVNNTPKPPLNLRGGAERSEAGELGVGNKKLENLLHKTIKKVTEDIENYKFNTAISAMMILLNELEKITPHQKSQGEPLTLDMFETFLKLLAPFAPHMTDEIWNSPTSLKLCGANESSIHLEEWPKYDESKIKEENVIIVVQINGKVRAQFEAETGISEKEAQEKALIMPDVQKWLDDKEIKKTIFVLNKIVNFVV